MISLFVVEALIVCPPAAAGGSILNEILCLHFHFPLSIPNEILCFHFLMHFDSREKLRLVERFLVFDFATSDFGDQPFKH